MKRSWNEEGMGSNKSDNINFSRLEADERKDLRDRILGSAQRHKSRKQRIKYAMIGIAASVSLIAGFGLFFQKAPAPSIADYVASSGKVSIGDAEEVTLILSENRSLKTTEKLARIDYSNSGGNVTIGDTKEMIRKESKDNKPVYNTLLVPYGKRSRITLSDGSTVWLNSGSRLVYSAFFNGDRREVYLEGEAIFDVAHRNDHPFVVVSEGQEVEVLGTVFGVTNYLEEGSIKTVLKSGSVQITYQEGSTPSDHGRVRIEPGTIASYDKDTKSMRSDKINVDDYFSWREGVLIFKSNDLRVIMNRIARYYNTKITIGEEAVTGETFSGYLDLNDDIDIVLENIKESANINYTITDEEIIIDRKEKKK